VKVQNILIIKLGSIGDVVHTLPTLHSLRKNFPQAHIAWVIEPKSRDILINHPDLNEIITFERTNSTWRTIGAFFRLVKKLRRNKYDCVLELQGNLKGGLLAWLTGSSSRLGFEAGSSRVERFSTLFTNIKVEEGDVPHILERNLNFARKLGVEDREISFPMAIGREEKEYIGSFLKEKGISDRQIVILHPGVTWDTKRWPRERYARLAEEIQGRFENVAVVLTYGPGERYLAEDIRKLSRSSPIVSPPTTLGQLIALLERSQVFVSSDTGPLHIAAALGKRVIGLYGPVDSRRNGPYGRGNFVIKKDLPCQPCWQKKCSSRACMKGIEVSEVREKVELLLETYNAEEKIRGQEAKGASKKL